MRKKTEKEYREEIRNLIRLRRRVLLAIQVVQKEIEIIGLGIERKKKVLNTQKEILLNDSKKRRKQKFKLKRLLKDLHVINQKLVYRKKKIEKKKKKKLKELKKKEDYTTKKYGPEYCSDLSDLELTNGEEENE